MMQIPWEIEASSTLKSQYRKTIWGLFQDYRWFRKRMLNIICHIKGSIAKTCLDDVHHHENLCTSL